ncbi:MAG: zinc dependent phospholipase C family protein [Clostridiales bacterium]|nr:zinc dependent phospholipase C family protein [Clostridiales bacterium]
MRKQDHIKLARFWIKNAERPIPRLCQLAFIYGSFEPDINALTYLHGFLKYQKFHGHNYKNVVPIIMRMLDHNMGKPLSIRRWYRWGKCFHYIADIFTFPHNEIYQGSLREHIEYEEELGLYWDVRLSTCHTRLSAFSADAEALKSYLMELHQIYLSDSHGLHQDCNYILAATQMMMEACLSCDMEADPYLQEEESLFPGLDMPLFPEFDMSLFPEEGWLYAENVELIEKMALERVKVHSPMLK